MNPTPEQEDAIDLFLAELGLAIEAGAGTGKTTTLQMMGRATQRRGQYVAFNTSIVNEAQRKMPRNVAAATMHKLAMRSAGRSLRHRLEAGRMRSSQIALLLDTRHFSVKYGAQTKVLQPSYLGSLAMRSIQRFCQSADPEPLPVHVPYVHGIDVPTNDGPGWENNDRLREMLAPALTAAWKDLIDPGGKLPFRHDHYLKLWQLSDPRIPADFILFDEAQDASPVMLAIVAAQTDSQLVFVGDSQQQIYAWRGAVNALQAVPGDARTFLTHCQPAGTMVRQAERVNGRQWSSREVPIETLRVGDRVVSWGRSHGIRRAGQRVTDVNIRPHDGPVVVVEAAGMTSRYTPDHHCVVMLGERDGGVVYLMRRNGQYRVGRAPWSYGSSRAFGPKLRAKHEDADALWVLSVHDTTADAALAERLTQLRFGLPGESFTDQRHYKMPLDSFWTKVGDNSTAAESCLRHHQLLVDEPLWVRSEDQVRLGSTVMVTAAANVFDGMLVRLADGGWVPAAIRREWYCGPIYSISVETDHTYVADGIVTHNSFRFGPEIAEVANIILARLDADLRLVGRGADSAVTHVADPRCILTRTNAASVNALLVEQRRGRRPHLIGGGDEVLSFTRAAKELKAGTPVMHPDLACFESWLEVLEYVAQDPQGDELRLLVDLIEEFGVDAIVRALDPVKMPLEPDADVVVSTVHKAKGREWDSVRLASDFADPNERDDNAAEEWRLLYVAATRARSALDVDDCGPVRDLLAGATQPQPQEV